MEFAPAPFPDESRGGLPARRGSTPTSWCPQLAAAQRVRVRVVDRGDRRHPRGHLGRAGRRRPPGRRPPRTPTTSGPARRSSGSSRTGGRRSPSRTAIWAAGAISVPVVPIYREHELAAIMRAVRAGLRDRPAVVPGSRPRRHARCGGAGGGARRSTLRVVVRGEATGWASLGRRACRRRPHVEPTIDPGRADDRRASRRARRRAPRARSSAPAGSWRCRSGTTARRRTRSATAAYMPAPVSHITGLLMAVTLPLVSGCSVVLRERWDAAQRRRRHAALRRDVHRRGDGVHPGAGRRGARPPGSRRCRSRAVTTCGGSAIPLDVVERAEALGFRPRRAYGMTECPTVSASLGDDGPDVRCVTDGRILPGVEVRVGGRRRVATSSRAARASSSCAGPSACSATSTRSTPATASTPTAGSAAATSASSTTATASAVTGRTKDVINRGGEKLSAQEIEALLRRHPDVSRRRRGRRHRTRAWARSRPRS